MSSCRRVRLVLQVRTVFRGEGGGWGGCGIQYSRGGLRRGECDAWYWGVGVTQGGCCAADGALDGTLIELIVQHFTLHMSLT